MFSALHVRIAHDAPSAEKKEIRREADRPREQRSHAARMDQPRGEELNVNDSSADRERKADA